MAERKRYTAAAILAMHYGMSNTDLRDHIYQPGRNTGSVYAFSDDYLCCVPIGKKPYQPRGGMIQWDWKPLESSFAQGQGYQIWRHENK